MKKRDTVTVDLVCVNGVISELMSAFFGTPTGSVYLLLFPVTRSVRFLPQLLCLPCMQLGELLEALEFPVVLHTKHKSV
jgi:hypothetical protein